MRTVAFCLSALFVAEGLPGQRAVAASGDPSSSEPLAEGGALSRSAAGPNGQRIEEVVVDARRRQENAQDVPIPMAVISGDSLERYGIDNPRELNSLAPNMVITETNPRQTIVGIRGIGNTSLLSDGLDASVGVYEDGVYLGRPGEFSYDFKDIDQITIMRGPQGTLYGRNTTGGAINVTSRLPSFTPEASVEASYGDYFLREYNVSASGPVAGDRLALRLTAYDTKRDGTVNNLLTGGRDNAENRYGMRAQALFVPTDDFSFRLIGSYRRQDEAQSDYLFVANQPVKAGGYNFSKSASLVAPGYAPPSDPFNRETDHDGAQNDQTHQTLLSGEANWNFGEGYKLTSISAYQYWYFRPNNDGDWTALPAIYNAGNVNKVQQLSQELRVTSPSGRDVEYVSGLYVFKQDINGLNRTYNDVDAWVFNSTLAALNGNAVRNSALSSMMKGLNSFVLEKPVTHSYAAYSQATWHLDRQWALTGGLRETYERKNQTITSYDSGNTQLITCAQTGSNCTFGGYTLSSATATKAIASFAPGATQFSVVSNSLSGLLTLSDKITDTVMAYATLSRGDKSPGVNVSLLPANLLASGATYVTKPEKSNNVELGIKNELLDKRLQFNTNVFWDVVNNYQNNAVYMINGSAKQALTNVGAIRSGGLETDIVFQPVSGLRIGANGSFTDAIYRSYHNAPCSPEASAAGAATCDLTGAPVANTPRWIGNVSTEYSRPLVQDLSAYGGIEYAYRTKAFLTTDNSAYGKVGAYGVTNLRVGVRVIDDSYDVSVWARNVFDTRYYQNVQENYGAYYAYLGEPRTVGFTLRAKF
ncbi:TonB-dependent receptor [Telmatospirillum sp.]|uniref:TonB-dependent receptor n=1 Tax=Telmatospirillum sp. TaxID=2079197 RepID=UPI00284FC4EC|nr:TonB-dependent receptor [Telmatospirillum sp.]MDR3438377.1 TonB-dependent receptor [Telmatospirillum sp.]